VAEPGEFGVVPHLAALHHGEAFDGKRHQPRQVRRVAGGRLRLAIRRRARAQGDVKLEFEVNGSRRSVTLHLRLLARRPGTSAEFLRNGN